MRGFSTSTMATRPAALSSTPTLCALFGLFNYLSIQQFINFNVAAERSILKMEGFGPPFFCNVS